MFSRFLQDNHVCVCVCVCACVRACVRACVVCVVFVGRFIKNNMHPSFYTFHSHSLHNIGIYGSFTEKGLSAWAK